MYYELGTMVAIKKDASPFVDHDKGISIPSIDVVGEIVGIRPSILSYAVRLSKKYVLTFNEDDIYGLPGWMSDKRYMFHKMLGSITAGVHPFYYVEEFEAFVSRAEEKQASMYYPNHRWDPKFMENMYPVKSSLEALDELNRREAEIIAASPIRIDIDDAIKANYSKEEIKKMINKAFGIPKFEYKKIIFNGPCTIILWKDGTKTIAKASDSEMFDPEKGVAICFMKKMLGHTETNKVLRKVHKQYEDYLLKNAMNVELIDDPKDLHTLEPTEYRLNFVNPIAHVSDINPNSVICIDQSTIDEVKKVEEENENNNLAVGSRCSTCEYFDKPMTKDPCCYCLSGDQYKKREEEQE